MVVDGCPVATIMWNSTSGQMTCLACRTAWARRPLKGLQANNARINSLPKTVHPSRCAILYGYNMDGLGADTARRQPLDAIRRELHLR